MGGESGENLKFPLQCENVITVRIQNLRTNLQQKTEEEKTEEVKTEEGKLGYKVGRPGRV